MSIATTVGDALTLEGIQYQVLRHPPSASAAESGRIARIRLERLAKAVLLKDFNGYLLAVLPASCRLDLEQLNALLHRRLELADELELDQNFYDCRLGAVPPLGPWYRIPTVVDQALRVQPEVYFEAGDHETLVRVSETEFERLLDGAEYLSFAIDINGSPAAANGHPVRGTH